MTPRLLIVSNRLPIVARVDDGQLRLAVSSGGLATGLRSWHDRSDGLWIGWAGDTGRLSPALQRQLEERLAAHRVVPVPLTRDEVERYYEGFSNRVVWPLFHYLVDRVPVEASGWGAYQAVNEKFARSVADVYRPGDVIWVHDYQLMLVPGLLRELIPDARIGFFLHIPFPSSEVFRVLPWRHQILQGLLGADLVGFHTFSYQRHFVASLLHIEGIEADIDSIRTSGRVVRLGVFPMSVDVKGFEALARSPQVLADAAAIRADAGGRRILLGVDRLDYTKGIPRRLLALERLLTREPALRDEIRYVQVAVPSRSTVDSYQLFRRQVEEAVGRINGACATLRSVPIHYMHRSVSRKELAALFCAADVMLVTPLRDGMNLVAKEFLASRVDGDGVLVLSEFAGAAAELGEALLVNPYDVDAVAGTMEQALRMSAEERRARMRGLRRRVASYDIQRWVGQFIDQLTAVTPSARIPVPARAPADIPELMSRLLHRPLVLLLDYDGTLVPIAPAPELAAPDAELQLLLGELSRRSDVELHLVSGRPQAVFEEWFGGLSAALWAEHGFWHRPRGGGPWQPAGVVPEQTMEKVLPILEHFAAQTPGALVERKTAALAWHYRMAEPGFGARQAHELRMLLGDALSNQPLEVLEGKKVIEVRMRGISKALVSRRVAPSVVDPRSIVAIGDDRTDEDLFAALPEGSLTIVIGSAPSRAAHRLSDVRAVRQLLQMLVGRTVTPKT
ncbi:MAG TPA: bifunctional alpha,alpha-trehalose-phosphate synthase (UDP-forming)/trehalose-phosphatase [Vicinamibacterales bacterium]|nr:bifunctional alpha,alpha-trehalose-phosphate synthase (UDP-forming)/trehalose-phosphatase [Vicinamibacterales bacterium]